jgi:hypothetical protein
MRRLLKPAAFLIVLTAIGIQFVRPAKTNPPTNPERALAARVHVPRDVAAVFDRACRDCHSNETTWPWYSNVAPVSWFVIDHVDHGRSHFNYSNWAKYEPDEAASLLEDTCELARKGKMPLPSYLWMHGNARLAPGDVEQICAWTKTTLALIASHRRP